jgi:hypothetical protein
MNNIGLPDFYDKKINLKYPQLILWNKFFVSFCSLFLWVKCIQREPNLFIGRISCTYLPYNLWVSLCGAVVQHTKYTLPTKIDNKMRRTTYFIAWVRDKNIKSIYGIKAHTWKPIYELKRGKTRYRAKHWN